MLKASRLLSGRGAGTWTQAWLTGALLLTTTPGDLLELLQGWAQTPSALGVPI